MRKLTYEEYQAEQEAADRSFNALLDKMDLSTYVLRKKVGRLADTAQRDFNPLYWVRCKDLLEDRDIIFVYDLFFKMERESILVDKEEVLLKRCVPLSIRDLRELTGLSQRAFSNYTRVPYRTIQNWESNPGSCTDYDLMFISRSIHRDFDLPAVATRETLQDFETSILDRLNAVARKEGTVYINFCDVLSECKVLSISNHSVEKISTVFKSENPEYNVEYPRSEFESGNLGKYLKFYHLDRVLDEAEEDWKRGDFPYDDDDYK